MSKFWLHIFCFLSFVNFLLLNIIIVYSFLIIIPIILGLFLSLFPSPSCILIFKVNILHIFKLIFWLSKLRTRKYLCWLLLYFLGLSNYCVSAKNNWTWSIRFVGFLGILRILWFIIIPWPISRGITLSELRIKFFRGSISLVVSCFRMLPAHWSLSFKYYKKFIFYITNHC